MDTQKTILVTGDTAVDWTLIANTHFNDRGINRFCAQPGGVLLLTELLKQIIEQTNSSENDMSSKWELKKKELCASDIRPENVNITHSFASWDRYAEKKDNKSSNSWRVKEFWGLEKAKTEAKDISTAGLDLSDNDTNAQIVVIDDADFGFRDNKALWPKAVLTPEKGRNPLIILKMSGPVAEGDLWRYLHNNLSDNLIVIVSADNLRKSDVQISRELSWERTAQDTVNELLYNPAINSLSDCKKVIVTFDNAGAIVTSMKYSDVDGKLAKAIPEAKLIFDPRVIEDMWQQSYEGGMLGYQTCFVAAVIKQCLNDVVDIEKGIINGLSAMRLLLSKGYDETISNNGRKTITFPFERIVSCICADTVCQSDSNFSVVKIQYPNHIPGSIPDETDELWTILKSDGNKDFELLACDIIKNGAEASLKNVPLCIYNKMLTVDRREIEGFRSINTLIKEYCANTNTDKPLSFAVFGPPGSGKSFGVKQISSSLSYKITDLTFNLSQMKSSDELIDAYHQIRDKVLKGFIPLVFWDEFDTTLDGVKLGWLRYFLAPMQDGEFSDRQINHPIGKAIFVFAGGTCDSFQKFIKSNEKEFIDVKGPDFCSRLRGYVNILGVNPVKTKDKPDPTFIIRRAILIRSIMERTLPESMFNKNGKMKVLNIDRGVLLAFLQIDKYNHGARSIEAIISMSMLSGRQKYERSSLPSAAQLNIHVNGREFMKLADTFHFNEQHLEMLAKASHEVFCENLKLKGYILGPERCHSGSIKTHPLLVDYAELPKYYKENNRENVRDIPNKLAKIDCVVTIAADGKSSYKLNPSEIELLAEMEHVRYMLHAIKYGWHYENVKAKAFPADSTLLPWRKMSKDETEKLYGLDAANAIGLDGLPDEEKDKDRAIISAIPFIIEKAGFIVEKLRR
ncbi:MAG: RyR domain-containing protein [Eubacteriales bacterium]